MEEVGPAVGSRGLHGRKGFPAWGSGGVVGGIAMLGFLWGDQLEGGASGSKRSAGVWV